MSDGVGVSVSLSRRETPLRPQLRGEGDQRPIGLVAVTLRPGLRATGLAGGEPADRADPPPLTSAKRIALRANHTRRRSICSALVMRTVVFGPVDDGPSQRSAASLPTRFLRNIAKASAPLRAAASLSACGMGLPFGARDDRQTQHRANGEHRSAPFMETQNE